MFPSLEDSRSNADNLLGPKRRLLAGAPTVEPMAPTVESAPQGVAASQHRSETRPRRPRPSLTVSGLLESLPRALKTLGPTPCNKSATNPTKKPPPKERPDPKPLRFLHAGGGTRTPDTRIMIPLL